MSDLTVRGTSDETFSASAAPPGSHPLSYTLRAIFASLGLYATFFERWMKGELKFNSWEDFEAELRKSSGRVGADLDYWTKELKRLLNETMFLALGITDKGDKPLKDVKSGDLGVFEELREIILKKNPNATTTEFYDEIFKQMFAQFIKKGFDRTMVTGDSQFNLGDAFVFYFDTFLTLGTRNPIIKDPKMEDYRKVYFQKNPGHTEQDFQEAFEKYYDKAISEVGYFLPSHFINGWEKEITLIVDLPKIPRSRGMIFFELLEKISEAIEVMQLVTIEQGEYSSNFYAPALRIYTEFISSIPLPTLDLIQKWESKEDKRMELLQHISGINSAAQEKLRGYRSQLTDEAKGFTAGTEQSQQAVQQLIALFENPIQTLLSVIRSLYKM